MSPVPVFRSREPPREVPAQGGDDQEGEASEIRHKFATSLLIAPDVDREPRDG